VTDPTPILTDASAIRQRMHEKSISAIASTFPLTLRNGTLEVQDLKVVSRQFSPIDQYNALMREGTLQEAVKGTLILKDKEGKVVDTAKNFTLVHVPHLTERHTLIMGGNEYQVANQLRRKPGVYTSRADNGELRAIFNLGRGSNFNLGFTPDKGTFHVQLGTSNIPLYPVLRAAGVSHETIAHHLGDAVAKANQTYHGKEEEKATGKLYAKLEHPALFKADLPHAEKVEAIRKKWDVTTLDPHVTEATLGTAYSKVTPEALLTAARKVLDVHAGHKTTDDTDALTYKTFHSLDDFLHERIKLTARAWGPKAKLALATKGTIREALRPAPFSDGVRKFITTGSLAAVPTAINPLELIDHAVKVTSLGEGGIPSDRAIPLDARMIHNTHFGALDPIRTPECFPPDMEVCTQRGWARWDSVSDSDAFLTMSGSLRVFQLPDRIVREPYEGLLCHMVGNAIDCVVTPNHRVYGRATEFADDNFVEAWELQGATQWYFPTEDPNFDSVYESELRTSVQPYRGMVYCATVPGGLLYVRRNGCTPYWTGNSSHSGVDIRATIAAHRDEAGNMYTVATNVKTKQPEYLRAGDLRKYVLAFPGEELKGTVDAIKNGRVERVPASTVTHQIAHTSHLYSPATTLLPLIHGMQGNRAIMASKMGTQALPLIEREAPFVQSKSHLPGEISFEAVYGHMIAPRAPVSGKVVKIEDGWIHIRPESTVKKAEDRPTVKERSFGPFKFHIEIPKGAKPFGDPFPCDYGYLPGYVGPDGDSLDFWVGTDTDGALVSVDTEEKNASDVWVKRDTKYIVGIAADDVHVVLTQIERKPKTRCVNRRNYTSWEALTKSIEHFKDEEDHVEKTAATKEDGLIRVPYSQNFPFPSKTSLNHTLSVKPGDTVVAGQRMGDSNYTKDGVLALGRNLRVAYVPYYGLNSNDAVVISEACAKKLTSEHVYREVFSIPVGMEFSKERHQFYYGTKYSPAQYAVLDTHGVIKKGVRVNPKDLLVCGLVKTQVVGTDAILGRISKALAKPYQEVALTWNHGTPGEVIDVVRTGSQIAVLVKTIEQMQVGDKLAGRHGNKGVVAKILPDHEMLKDEAGNTLDLLLTSAGVISRINPSQVLETSLGKVVEKTGKPIIFDNNTPRNLEAWTAEQLKKHGIKDKEHLYDPILKRHIKGADGEGVFVGRQFIYKLFKSTDTNFSGHGVGPYDLNEQPLKTGGEESAKGIGKMEFDALIAHNARNFLREASAIKGQKNDEFWRAIQLGLPLPAAKSPFAFKKFVGMLEGAGLKVDQRGSKFQLLPMTDKDIVARSTGAIKKPETLIAKNLRPEPGGLFDARLTGGPQGTLYSHIDLHEPIPHPVFKEPVRRLLGLTEKGFDEKLRAHGGTWFYNELKALDTDQKLKDLHVRLKTAKGSDLNDTVKQIKYLDALNAHGYKPHDAYVVSKVPVVPPVFRPIIPQPNNPGELMVADANKLYMHVMDSNHTLKNTALESDVGKHRRQVFNAVAALYGTEDVENDELRGQSVKGFLSNIAGVGTPKGGFFQRKVIRKTQDVSGRGTAVPDPTLGMDNVGIPEQMLWQMYDKLIIARMVRQGHTALEAKEAVLKKTPAAKAVLMQEIGERPVMINRAPTLHRWSIVAAYPVPVQGKTIRVNPFIEKGLNLDYDGDNQDSTVILIMAKPPLGGCHNRGSYLDFTTDSATVVLPGDLRLPRMEEHMAARFRSEVPALINQELVLCDLANFPHGEQISQKGHITFYAVPENVSILALDEATGRVCVQHPTLWSRHAQRERYIITLGSERQIFSDDDPRAVYGLDSDLNYIRRRPSESVGVFVPVSYGALGDGSDAPFETLPATDTSPVFPLTEEAGHLIGMMIGNGTVEPYRLRLAGMNKGIQTQFRTVLPSLFPEVALKFAVYGHDASGGFGDSEVTCVTSEPGTLVASRFHGMFGHGAENKHLPTWFLRTSYAFRRGLLAGLIDTDGSVSVSHGKKKPQWMVNYSSRSGRLAREIVLLAQSLGLRAKVTAAKTPLGDPHYVVNFSTVELGRFGALPLVHTEKVVKFREFQADPPEANSSYNATNLVPVPATIAKQLSRLFKSGGSDYAKWYQSIKKGYVARAFAEETLALHPTLRESEDTLLHRWITLVDNKTIRWDQVTAFQKTGITEDGYDLTVPGYETFMNVEGVILSNTLQVHAPVTHDAIADAKKMTLSNMLLADNTRNKILAFPQHEAIIGFTHGSKLAPSNKPIQHFKTMDEAIAAYKRGALAANDRIEIP